LTLGRGYLVAFLWLWQWQGIEVLVHITFYFNCVCNITKSCSATNYQHSNIFLATSWTGRSIARAAFILCLTKVWQSNYLLRSLIIILMLALYSDISNVNVYVRVHLAILNTICVTHLSFYFFFRLASLNPLAWEVFTFQNRTFGWFIIDILSLRFDIKRLRKYTHFLNANHNIKYYAKTSSRLKLPTEIYPDQYLSHFKRCKLASGFVVVCL
jgi:hypothetical protein